MPIQLINRGGLPITSHCSRGTMGTYKAVRNADLLLLMVCRPKVCRP